jgi:DNA-binding Lrp family transcriptional regulator/YHS domain-containing protein
MTRFDETDMEILRLLLADGRRTYSDIAETVDLSAPAVSDRIDRLREDGVIRRVTVDLDRSKLTGGTPVMVEVRAAPGAIETVRDGLAAREDVEHVFATADARVFAKAFVEDGDVRGLLAGAVDLDDVRSFDVHLLTDAEWTPGLSGTAFDLDCAECGNSVTEEGETTAIDGERYHFCCSSCESRFRDRYEELEAGAD